MCSAYINDALDKVSFSGKRAINAFAEGDMQRMMLLGLKRFTKGNNTNTIALRRKVADKLIEENCYCF